MKNERSYTHKIYSTFKRVDQQITFNSIPDKYKDDVILVVQEQERHLYKHDVECTQL